MKKGMNRAAGVLAVAMGFVVLAAGFVAERSELDTEDWPADDTVTVAVEIGPKGFNPSEITLEKDRPARISSLPQ